MKLNKMLILIPLEFEKVFSKINSGRVDAGKKPIDKFVMITQAIMMGINNSKLEDESEKLFLSGKAPNPRKMTEVKKVVRKTIHK